MNAILETHNLTLEPYDSRRLANLCGQFDEHLKQIESHLDVEIRNRGNLFQLTGEVQSVERARNVIGQLYTDTESSQLTPDKIHLAIVESGNESSQHESADASNNNGDGKGLREESVIRTRRALIKLRGKNQKQYVHNIRNFDINFGVGPAGTGKTYLAVASAVDALEREEVRRILLVRPAVEAGEKLGFLPGDMADKINPYLRPLYDALFEMLGFDRVNKLIERNIIEVAPLAYMRGRTLNHAFIILDESQNTTREQMKMFLTRIGFGSKAVITGDQTQVDLPRGTHSGLRHVLSFLPQVGGIGFTYFQPVDVVRHSLVQRIVEAYDDDEKTHKEQQKHDPQNPAKGDGH